METGNVGRGGICGMRLNLHHLSIGYLNLDIHLEGHMGLESIPAHIGRVAEYTLDRSPVCRRAIIPSLNVI